MAKALPIKTKRRSTAAYAASQPLFDALRNGMERIADQRANLATARDSVQKLHVKLPSTSIADDVQASHETYMDGAVKAWRLATESYAAIFDALADVTAAEPSSGRKKRDGHEQFVKMAASARDAYEVAMDWKLSTPRSSVDGEAQGGQGVDKDEDMEVATTVPSEGEDEQEGKNGVAVQSTKSDGVKAGTNEPTDNRPTNPILMSLLKQKPLSEGGGGSEKKSMSNGVGGDDADEVSKGSVKKDTGKAQKRLQKRQKRREERAKKGTQQAKAAAASEETAKPSTQPIDKSSTNPDNDLLPRKPDYDDVSAEVAARLKAKEEKESKKQANKEKKRKRESRDSTQNGEAVEVKAEKPRKKKARSNEGEVVEDAAKKETARKHGRDGEAIEEIDGGAKEGRKKRKKV